MPSSPETKTASPLGWRHGALTPIPFQLASRRDAPPTAVSGPGPYAPMTGSDIYYNDGPASRMEAFGHGNYPPYATTVDHMVMPPHDFYHSGNQFVPSIAPAPSSESLASFGPTFPQITAAYEQIDNHHHYPPYYYTPPLPVFGPPPPPGAFYPPYPSYAASPWYPPYPLGPPPPVSQGPPVEYITAIQPQDVLSGRGGATNSHSGNKEFRRLVKKHQPEYLRAKKRDKPLVAALVVRLVRERGGRFLRRLDRVNHLGQVFYVDIGDERAKEKACQALREGAPEMRRKHVATAPELEDNKNDENPEGVEFENEDDTKLHQTSVGDDNALRDDKENHIAPTVMDATSDLPVDSSDEKSANSNKPTMIRPCARLMPNRRPIKPYPVDQLSPEMRDMYLRDFLPPSNPPRKKAVNLKFESSDEALCERENDKCVQSAWPSVKV